jgi:SAM-dependent methyltransferase
MDEADLIIGLYRRHAADWDRARGRTLFERPWLDRFTSLLPAGGSVLDIGCGSGEPIASYLIGAGLAVTGIDSAPEMVALCEARFPASQWHVADMRALAVGRQFQGLLAWDSFFHLTPEDQRAMFAIFDRHAASHAALMFTSGPAFGHAVGTFHGEPLYHGSLDAASYRTLLRSYGFAVVAQATNDPDCGGHTVWLAARP